MNSKNAIVGIIAGWAVWAIAVPIVVHFMPSLSIEKAGVFGDMFGALNALFTGLALWGLLHSWQLTRKQIQQAESATKQELRPWVSLRLDTALGPLTEEKSNFIFHLHGHYINHGSSPALHVSFQPFMLVLAPNQNIDDVILARLGPAALDTVRHEISFQGETQKLPRLLAALSAGDLPKTKGVKGHEIIVGCRLCYKSPLASDPLWTVAAYHLRVSEPQYGTKQPMPVLELSTANSHLLVDSHFSAV